MGNNADLTYVLAEFIVYNADTLVKDYEPLSQVMTPRAFIKEVVGSYYSNVYTPEDITTALADEKLSRTIKLIFWSRDAEDKVH